MVTESGLGLSQAQTTIPSVLSLLSLASSPLSTPYKRGSVLSRSREAQQLFQEFMLLSLCHDNHGKLKFLTQKSGTFLLF